VHAEWIDGQSGLSQFEDEDCAKNVFLQMLLVPPSLKLSDFPTGHIVGGTLEISRPLRMVGCAASSLSNGPATVGL
jgi:hypothetical protein